MIKKLNPNQLELLGAFRHPSITAKVLFKNEVQDYGALSQMKSFEEEGFETRKYQIPYRSFEYLIIPDKKKTAKQNFKDKIKAGSGYWYTGRGTGKCEWAENVCILANGAEVKFKDLIGTTQKVLSLNQENNKITPAIAFFKDNGIRPCYKITLKTGKTITVTFNHPLLTEVGWVQSKDLKVGNFVATPKRTRLYHSTRKKWQKIAKASNNKEIDKIAYSDIYWDVIKKIEFVGNKPTVAVEVPKYHNYISNYIFSHNTLVALLQDLLFDTIFNFKSWTTVFSSFDKDHVQYILEPYLDIMERHSFFRLFNLSKKTRQPYKIYTKLGHKLEGIGWGLSSSNPASSFEKFHAQKHVIDEHEYETETVLKKRSQAKSDYGCIAEESKILMSDFSVKNIEDIEIGDKVIGFDEIKNCLVKTEVTNKFTTGYKDVININNQENNLWLTPDHRLKTTTEGDKCYRWRQAGSFLLTKNYAPFFTYYNNTIDYYKGILLGLIESDGSHIILKGKKKRILHQFKLYQAEATELEFFRFILNYFGLDYQETLKDNSQFNNGSVLHVFNIKRKYNDFLLKIYKDLEKNKDIQQGFICGFIVGDGYLNNGNSFALTQNKRNYNKIQLLLKILQKLNVYYNYRKALKNGQIVYFIELSKYSIPFYNSSKKSQKYIKNILNIPRPVFHKKEIQIKGFKEKVKVWDLTTKTHNFIANGFLVHNCIERFAGITSFSKNSPAGRIYDSWKRTGKQWLTNIPKYVVPEWDAEMKAQAIQDYSGQDSLGFRVHILAEIVGDLEGLFDMDRVRNNYVNRKIQRFEIDKNNFFNFKDRLVIEKWKNAVRTWIGADWGGDGNYSAPTEITVIFEIENQPQNKYCLAYNITLYRLKQEEKEEVFKYLIDVLLPNIVAIDATSPGGREIFRNLKKEYPNFKDRFIEVNFNEKMAVGIERDKEGNIVTKNGAVVYKEEWVVDWSIRRLRYLFYNYRFEIPRNDYKFDKEFDNMIGVKKSSRWAYDTKLASGQDHYFQSLQTFAIAEFKVDFNSDSPITSQRWDTWPIGV